MREPVLGLWLFRNRWYDSVNGMWLTRDPAGYVHGLNLYRYASGNRKSGEFRLGGTKRVARWSQYMPLLTGNITG